MSPTEGNLTDRLLTLAAAAADLAVDDLRAAAAEADVVAAATAIEASWLTSNVHV